MKRNTQNYEEEGETINCENDGEGSVNNNVLGTSVSLLLKEDRETLQRDSDWCLSELEVP